MRGKVCNVQKLHIANGITPAHAGKSFFTARPPQTCQDHPRTCGEKLMCARFQKRESGSPPHMRGKVEVNRQAIRKCGITPAHAGKRELAAATKSLCGDHPRTCGEKSVVLNTLEHRLGSPPHMRGKVALQHAPDRNFRITPAHAGKSIPATV